MLKCDFHKVAKRVVLIVSKKFEHFSSKSLHFKNQPPEVFYKKGVLKNFTKFAGKHQSHGLFFNKVAVNKLY